MRNLLAILFLMFTAAKAQVNLNSGINDASVTLQDSNAYAFLVSGHFHGSSSNQSGFPAATILANIDFLNNDGSAFMVSTGDLFMDVRNNIPNYRKALFSKLKKPLFNAVGNHDLSGKLYEKEFGLTWYSFNTQNELFVVLNTEKNDGSIKGEQLNFLKETLKKHHLKNIFIFSHRPIWTEGNPDLENVFKENTRSDFGNNFQTEVLPLLKQYASESNIYWFSGSLGGNAPASFFYYKDKDNITYIQSAIRDLPRDGLLKVNVKNGKVSFETISLTGQKMPKLEACGLNIWKNPPAEPFNYRLVPLYTKQMLFHRYFWYGVVLTLAFTLLVVFIRRRKKRKKSG